MIEVKRRKALENCIEVKRTFLFGKEAFSLLKKPVSPGNRIDFLFNSELPGVDVSQDSRNTMRLRSRMDRTGTWAVHPAVDGFNGLILVGDQDDTIRGGGTQQDQKALLIELACM